MQPDIPHIDEHVSKVECIGVKTQQKLLDIKAAAATVGIQDLNVIHNTITTGTARASAGRSDVSSWIAVRQFLTGQIMGKGKTSMSVAHLILLSS